MTAFQLVLVGTGTGVGKTHVGCALIAAGEALGIEAVGLKPIETGLGAPSTAPSDQDRLEEVVRGFHVKRGSSPTFHVKRSPYRFADPVSPHLAARRAGVRIDLAVVVNWVRDHPASFVVVETAGGLFSPLADNATNLDLVAALGPAALLVAPDRLGVLHDVTATLGLAAARGFPIRAVVLSAPAEPDASSGQNAPELSRLGIAQPLAVFPRAPPSDSRSIAAATAVIHWAQHHRDSIRGPNL